MEEPKPIQPGMGPLVELIHKNLVSQYPENYGAKPEKEEDEEETYVKTVFKLPKFYTVKGDKGEDGKDGREGKDGKDGMPGKDGLNGKDGKDGIDGKDGVNTAPKDVIEAIRALKGNDRLDITNLRNGERLAFALQKKGNIDFDDMRWHGGGGDLLVKNEGVQITPRAISFDFVGGTINATSDANGNVTVTITDLGGDVVGPASATDEAIVRFNGTTGKLIQNSNGIITDAGNAFFAGNTLVAGTNDTLTVNSIGVNFEVSADTTLGFPITTIGYSNKSFSNPFTDEIIGLPARFSDLIITGGPLGYFHQSFTSDDTSPFGFAGYIGSTTPTDPVFGFSAQKWDGTTGGAGLASNEKFMQWATPGNTMMNVFGDGSMVFTGKLVFDNSLAFPTSSSIYIGKDVNGGNGFMLFNAPTGVGDFKWMIAETVAMQLTTPGAASITAADIIAQLQVGNNTADTFNFSKTSAVVYVSNAFPTAVSTANKGGVFKAVQTTTANFTAVTTQGLVGYGRSDTGSFNSGLIYGAQFQAQSNNLGGSVSSLIANNGIANFTSTHQGNITNTVTGVLGTAQMNATGASATGTVPIANGLWGQILKSTTDKLTVTEANGVLSGSHLINSALDTFYGFHFKEDTGAGVITTEYGLYLEAVTRGTTSVGAYIGGGTTWALWVDSGLTRLDGNLLIGATAAGASMTNGISMANGTDPSGNVADAFQFYSADTIAGNATPHFRTENGTIINLFQSPAYTITNVTTDRSYDANSTTLDELSDVVGTLIADLQATGLIG